MTVLIVDDQPSVLEGLVSNLDWNTLGITTIHTATGAASAKEILANESVDLLLCDIEMPGENGLSLLSWTREQGMNLICVFLTSHADFLYAQEAIHLGCFDYILQPARYQDIQATVLKAIARVKDIRNEKELSYYGILAKNQEAALFYNLFSEWGLGKEVSLPALRETLNKLGKSVNEDSLCLMVWGHLLRWHNEPWFTQEWIYALNNIVTEICRNFGYEILPFVIDNTSLGWFVYISQSIKKKLLQQENSIDVINQVYRAASQHLPCDLAFYVSPVVSLKEINLQSSLLLKAKQNNVLRENGIFCPTQQSDQFHVEKLLDTVKLHRWETLLIQGLSKVVEEEVESHLQSLAKTENLNRKSLRVFWIQFQQIAYHAAQVLEIDFQTVLAAIDQGEQATCLNEVESAIRKLVKCFPHVPRTVRNEKNLVEQVQKYIENNLDQALSVADVASALYMNGDYLSRALKNETGLSLKEYILRYKMESAQLLLTTTELPISVIAAKLGYDNFSYFSQVYRRCMGVSPSDERKKA